MNPARRSWLRALLALLCLLAAGRAAAQSAAAGDTAAEMVVPVESPAAAWYAQPLDAVAAPAVPGQEDYIGRQPQKLAELLAGVPGTLVLESGGDEGPWNVMIRGRDADAVAVYLDGILLNDPLGRPVDLSRIPAPLLDRVVVYRGAAPPGYPVSGTAGVIDLRTRPAASTRAVSGRLAYDSHGDGEAAAAAAGPALRGAGFAGVDLSGGPSDYLYLNDRGTPGDRGDDREDIRDHNAFGNYDLLLKWDRQAGGYRVYTAASYQYREHELSGPGAARASSSAERSNRGLIYAGIRRPGLISPNLDAEVRFHYLTEEALFRDGEGELGPPRREQGHWTRVGTDFFADYYGARSQAISAGLALYSDQYRSTDELDPAGEPLRYSRSSVYFTLADEISLRDGRLTLRPQARYAYEANSYRGRTLTGLAEGPDQNSSFMNLSVDLALQYLLAENLHLVARAAQYQRSPQFLDEFGDRSYLRGNLDLEPERALNSELGLVYEPGRFLRFDALRAELRLYDNRTQQRLGWTPLPDGTLEAENLGDASVIGAELGLSLNLQDEIMVDAAWAYQEPRNRTEDLLLPGAPRNLGHVGITLSRSYGQIFYDLYYQGPRYLDEQNRVEADARVLHNLGVLYYRGSYSVGIKAMNLGNDRDPEVLGYPVPGASYMVFMELKD